MALVFTFISLYTFSQNYTVLGDASPVGGCNCYRLTPDLNNQAGAIFQNQTIDLNNSFDFSFNGFLGCRNGNDAADGIVFVLTSNPNGLGSGGGGLGYAGGNQPYSLAVEFDTWENSNVGDPSYDHIGIESGGAVTHNVANSVPALPSSGNIDNCQWYTIRIVWDVNTGMFSVYFDGQLRISVSIPNMVNDYFGGNPIVNWGWTAGTGGGTNDQQICVLNTSSWVAGVNYQSCNLTMDFTDISTSSLGNIQSWAWDFGDGNTSTLQNPSHTYAALGTYNVSLTITDLSGCTNEYSHNVVIADSIQLSAVLNEPPCNGGNNGSIEIIPSSGFGPSAGYGGYSYDWSDGTSLATNVGITAGTYTVTVSDGVCNTVGEYTLDQPTPLTASTSATDASCGAMNGSVTISISGGTPPYQNVSWAGVAGYTRTGLGPNTYIADFEDANGCSALLQYTATVGNLPCGINSSVSSTDVSCNGGSNGSITLTVTGGSSGANVSWNGGAYTGFTISGLPAGIYNYTYTDNIPGNTFSGSVTISEPPVAMQGTLTTLNTSCDGINDGSAVASVTAGGTPGYTYNWSRPLPGSPVVNGLAPGAISVTITDNLGCEAIMNGNITGPPQLQLNITAVDDSCYQSGTGSAMANASGGNPPYTYAWSNVSSAQNNIELGVGTYTVTVTDDKGCTITGTTSISEPQPFSYTLNSENINCTGDADGSIEIANLSGGTMPYSYDWSPSTATGPNPVGLDTGKYVITVSDANNCSFTDSVTITEPDSALTVVSSFTDITCFGANNGTATIEISGGTRPYTYLGTPIPSDSITIENLPPGSFSGNIQDANGCSVFLSANIVEPAHIEFTEVHTDLSCFGGNDGTITTNAVGGTTPYSYEWSDTVFSQNRTDLLPGIYEVTLSDSNSCTETLSIEILEPAEVPLIVDVIDADCFGDLGSATALPSEGSGPYDYEWDNSADNTATVALINGNHNVTAISSEGCVQTANFSIGSQPQITLQVSSDNPLCNGDSTGNINVNVGGGAGGFTYTWTPSIGNNTNITGLPAGDYTLEVLDQNNCSTDTTITLSEPDLLTATLSTQDEVCFGDNNGSINVNAQGGTAAYNYNWNDSGSGSSRDNLSPGAYSVTITDANGCTVTISDSVSAALPIWVRTDTSVYRIYAGQTIEINSESFTNGNTVTQYNWEPIIGIDCADCASVNASPLETQTYTLSIVDEDGCTADTTFEIIVRNDQVFYVPSAFTPNGDGVNETFSVKSDGVVDFKFQIFDRWGNLVFETTDVNEEWDGTFRGSALPPDVFVYRVYADFLDKSSLRKKGSLTLIK